LYIISKGLTLCQLLHEVDSLRSTASGRQPQVDNLRLTTSGRQPQVDSLRSTRWHHRDSQSSV